MSLRPAVSNGNVVTSSAAGYVKQVHPATNILAWRQFVPTLIDTLGGSQFQILMLDGTATQWTVGYLNPLSVVNGTISVNKLDVSSGSNGQVLTSSSGGVVQWLTLSPPPVTTDYATLSVAGVNSNGGASYTTGANCAKVTITSSGDWLFALDCNFKNTDAPPNDLALWSLNMGLSVEGSGNLSGADMTSLNEIHPTSTSKWRERTISLRVRVSVVASPSVAYVVAFSFQSGICTVNTSIYAVKVG